MAQYCPQPGQLCAIARHETIRREKGFYKIISNFRRVFPCRMQWRFWCKKSHFRFYPSLFTKSSEPPINTKGVRGEELVVTLHGCNSLYIKYLCFIGEEWRVFLRVAFFKNEEIRGKKGFLPTDFLYLLCDKLPKGKLLILTPWSSPSLLPWSSGCMLNDRELPPLPCEHKHWHSWQTSLVPW